MAKREPNLTPVDGGRDDEDRKDEERRPARLKKVQRDQLAKIKTARKESINHANQAQTHQLQSQAADTAMRLLISQGLSELGIPIAGNVVCLECGAVRAEPPQGQPMNACPGCGAL